MPVSPVFGFHYRGRKIPLFGDNARYFAMKRFNRRVLMHERLVRILLEVTKKKLQQTRAYRRCYGYANMGTFPPLVDLDGSKIRLKSAKSLSNHFVPIWTPHHTPFDRNALKVAENTLETKKKKHGQPRGQKYSIPGFLDRLSARPLPAPPRVLHDTQISDPAS